MPAAPTQVFSREASGFVRVGTPGRMLGLNVMNIGLTYIMFTYWTHPGVFPQSHLLIAIPIAAAIALFFNLLYTMFATIMPRTGGEYVYLTRTFHPAIGFAASFAAATSQCFWTGIGGYWIGQLVLGPMLSGYAQVTGSSFANNLANFFNNPDVWFAFGTIFLVLMGLSVTFGLRTYLRFQDWNWIVGTLGGIILLAIFFLASNHSFQANYDQFAKNAGVLGYQATLDTARKAGMPTGFSIWDTFGIFSIIWLISWASTYLGAEVRTPKKTQLWGMVYGMLFYAGLAWVLALAIGKAVGFDFNQALTWLNYNYVPPSGQPGVPTSPTFMLYAGVLLHNGVVFTLIAIALVVFSYAWIPGAFLIATRAMFAWSFDRLAPEKLAEVHPRYRSPWVAVLVTAVLGELFLILYWKGVFKFLTPALAYYFVFWIVSLAGVLFPFLPKTKRLLEESSVNYRVAGIPLMSICGLFGLFYFSVSLYFMLTNSLLGLNASSSFLGITAPWGLITTALQFVVPFGLFFVARAVRRRQGVPIDVAFTMLPPE